MENIDYEDLKKRGFLKQRQDGYFIFRTRMKRGVYEKDVLKSLSDIAGKYGNGFAHATTRQGLEIPFIKFENITAVEAEVKIAGIETGTSGPRLRTTTICPGTNWCKQGLIDTFLLSERIEKLGIVCALDLPHKFKIAISGCPNTCTRAQFSDIGIHGDAVSIDGERKICYRVYLGGCGGRTPKTGTKLSKIFCEEEVLNLIAKVVKFYKEHGKSRERLALLMEEQGRENFIKAIGIQ